MSRAWLIDPGETQANVASTTAGKGDKEPWNGEFYVSFGDAASRSWEDARRFGFISGGGGNWYSQTLKLLSPGIGSGSRSQRKATSASAPCWSPFSL